MVDLEQKALQIRQATLDLIYKQGAGHLGSDLSCTDILVALYYAVMNIDAANPEASERDRYIQSKGHAAEVYWTILADKGFFPKEELDTFSQYGSRLIGHPNNKVGGVEMNTGSLGHGLAIATGIALAAKMDSKSYHTYVLMGDGELAEGSVWEAAMAAPHYQLHNLTAIIDRNGLQISGASEQVMAVEPLADKWEAFGWHVIEVDGNNVNELVRVLHQEPVPAKPTMIIANTIKGKGIHAAENNPAWHHYVPNEGEYLAATKDLQTGGERNE
ncbi:transketolase [Culicoidibacter larvae]|uniref:Transketolase n=1 Tax=Culicoidibacter larvae TaxID=2579976 RepID=A0A5R8QD73_9FIRM|nr:transketolase [Culicoidibacter larvae]TLG73933.1 transketolase [Culicoidibacter larvae]